MKHRRLFVYGSLAPGRQNEHVLEPLAGLRRSFSIRSGSAFSVIDEVLERTPNRGNFIALTVLRQVGSPGDRTPREAFPTEESDSGLDESI